MAYEQYVTTPELRDLAANSGKILQVQTDGSILAVTGSGGTTGAAGAPGSTWYQGTTVPAIGTGINGDYYLLLVSGAGNGNVYQKIAGAWTLEGNITGPTGATGAQGVMGPAGAQGVQGNTGAQGIAGTDGSGTVNSVALAAPGIFTVSGSPVTTTGTLTLALATQAANSVFRGPTSGSPAAPTFGAIVVADLPVMVASGGSHAAGIVPDPGSTSGTSKFLREDATWASLPTGTGTVNKVSVNGSSAITGDARINFISANGNLTIAAVDHATFTDGVDVTFTVGAQTPSWRINGGSASMGYVGLNLIAGTNIALTKTNAGTFSDTVDLTINFSSFLTTKGDIFTRAASADARLAVGTNGQVLTADSSQATGLRWGTLLNTPYSVTNISSPLTVPSPTQPTVVVCDVSVNPMTCTLPDATTAGVYPITFKIRATGTPHTLTLATVSSQTIDGSSSYTNTTSNNAVTLISDGANWQII